MECSQLLIVSMSESDLQFTTVKRQTGGAGVTFNTLQMCLKILY